MEPSWADFTWREANTETQIMGRRVKHVSRNKRKKGKKHTLNFETSTLPSGYLTVCHGKSPFLVGKPSISMGHLYHGYAK